MMCKIEAQPDLDVYGSRNGSVCIQQAAGGKPGTHRVVCIDPAALEQVIDRMRAAARNVKGPDVSGVKPRLPRDLKAALHPTRPRRVTIPSAHDVYGIDTIDLMPLNKLKVEPVILGTCVACPDRSPIPEDGYYWMPVVNLVRSNPRAIVWLPTERRYGRYDPEHSMLMAFRRNLTWTKLRADIDRYFAATNAGVADAELAEYICPGPSHKFFPLA